MWLVQVVSLSATSQAGCWPRSFLKVSSVGQNPFVEIGSDGVQLLDRFWRNRISRPTHG